MSTKGRSSAVVVSTVLEAWAVVHAGLVEDGTVKDVGDSPSLEIEQTGIIGAIDLIRAADRRR